MKRVIVGFLVAPLPAAFFQATVVGIWPKAGKGVFEHPASMFVVVCLYFYLVELLFALPLYLGLRKRPQQSLIAYGLVGALLVLTPVAIGVGIGAARGGLSTYAVVYNLAYFALGGFFAGLLFWRVTVARGGLSRA
jgi:hypothetical protein